jgi:hypothetical protein
MKYVSPLTRPRLRIAALVTAMSVSTAALNSASDIPESVRFLRPLHLDVKMRVDSQHDISLRLDPSLEPIGKQLDSHQMWKLDQIRTEIPQRFRILQNMFPRQISEYLLRQGIAAPTPAPTPRFEPSPSDTSTEVAIRIAERYLSEPLPTGFTEEQLRARHAFITAAARNLPAEKAALRPVLESCARYSDPDFGTAKKTEIFLALKKQYSPYKEIAMSVVGDTLILGGRIVTERLRADAAVESRTPEQFAQARRAELAQDLAQWRAAQISGDAYAGTIKSFLNDPRLQDFTPEETQLTSPPTALPRKKASRSPTRK